MEIECTICKEYAHSREFAKTPDFSTPNGFFMLWNWAKKQEWWITTFKSKWWGRYDTHLEFVPDEIIHPDMFADAIHKFLKENE